MQMHTCVCNNHACKYEINMHVLNLYMHDIPYKDGGAGSIGSSSIPTLKYILQHAHGKLVIYSNTTITTLLTTNSPVSHKSQGMLWLQIGC